MGQANKPTILIVDDSETDRQIMARILSQKGFDQLSFAATAKEGYQKALLEKPRIVIMDTVLPDRDGFELCEALSEKKGHFSYKILLTGHVEAIDSARAAQVGADKYIVKTHNYQMLLAALEKFVDANEDVH